MKASLLKKLCCPIDKHDLQFTLFATHENGDIAEGLLTCGFCNRYYPIVYGIPIMTPDEYRDKTLEVPILEKWKLSIDETDATTFLLKA